jgi:hypothetical protein
LAGVDAVFAPFYEARGGERIFGEAISEAFSLSSEGLTVQYFQNLRLEYATGQPQSVQITPLGVWGYEGLRDKDPDETETNGRSRTFPETNQTVRDEFLAFYEEYSGEQVLGWPISAQLSVGGVRTQYFENGRLEWRPQLSLDQRVQLGWLGREHFDSEMAFVYREFANAAPVAAAGVTDVNIMASVQSPVVYAGEEQLVFVTLLTATGEPVTDMRVSATLLYDGGTTAVDLGTTDGEGQLVHELDLIGIAPGQDVTLLLSVVNNGRAVGETTLTFKTWW